MIMIAVILIETAKVMGSVAVAVVTMRSIIEPQHLRVGRSRTIRIRASNIRREGVVVAVITIALIGKTVVKGSLPWRPLN